MDTFLKHSAVYMDKKSTASSHHKLISEKPLKIIIQDRLYSIIMRTPGDELPLAAGFCLSEGIVNKPDDIESLSFSNKSDGNEVILSLKKSKRNEIFQLFEKFSLSSKKEFNIGYSHVIRNHSQKIYPVKKDDIKLDFSNALNCLENLSSIQPLRKITRSSHAAALYSSDFELLSVSEDVGRHNALDKTIGKLFLDNTLCKASLLILSSRISCELVQKAAMAGIPVILAISRPTSNAVKLASQLNITIACLAEKSGLYVFCGKSRLVSYK
ncbi:MAG: formate dehydrogenase accessory sulfurtransferase FdhD [Proteobacteria bacterium]|nr:formate dehydrogenase accessory sulfurtransferase FdhD [Pseudomonadota bacterium]MBU4259914.1 formate dehydrogenase accessory sulfurtransferase FdhD [Pseudomonadota bacterium]MBU4286977.1 formate dehydrogenase accessory sulfurtransferase FdhD [Pseudomonadota bacterium]